MDQPPVRLEQGLLVARARQLVHQAAVLGGQFVQQLREHRFGQ